LTTKSIGCLIRASLRYASRKYWVPLARDLRPVYTAADETAAAAALEAFAAAWGDRYPAIVKLWRAHWAEFIPFLAFPPEVRRVIYTTNLIWVDERPAAEGHPQPRPVPVRAGRLEGALPGGPEPRGAPQPERRDPQLRVETGAAGIHDLLRRPNPNTMTNATIIYTDDRTLPVGC